MYDYSTYRFASCLTGYDKAVSDYISKVVRNVMLKLKVHFFEPCDPIFIIYLFAKFKQGATSIVPILERAATLVTIFFV